MIQAPVLVRAAFVGFGVLMKAASSLRTAPAVDTTATPAPKPAAPVRFEFVDDDDSYPLAEVRAWQ